MHFLLDTNVAVAANGKSDAEPACVTAAIDRLLRLKASEVLILDDSFLILNEYDRNLHATGRPGPGDDFYLWALRNRHNPQHCEQITLELDEGESFAAFPTAPELAAFDPADRKFVAAARTHAANPPVVNATDRDWHEHLPALTQHGVRVEFVCPQEMTRPRRQNSSSAP